MSNDLDDDFLSSVNSLSKELQVLGVDEKIVTTGSSVACQSLLGTAWMLVQFIHCNSVTTAESTLYSERENKLRDELQSTQSKLQLYKGKIEEKEKKIKSVELMMRKQGGELHKWQNSAESLSGKVKQLESKIERCHGFYKNELASLEAECEKIRDHLRSKLGIARKINDSLPVSLSRISISSRTIRQKNEENQLHAMEETVLSLKSENQILVAENLLMRDNFARLHRQLDCVRKHGTNVLQTLGIQDQANESTSCDYTHSLFSLPISVVTEKLQRLGDDQIEGIVNIFGLIDKAFSTAGCRNLEIKKLFH